MIAIDTKIIRESQDIAELVTFSCPEEGIKLKFIFSASREASDAQVEANKNAIESLPDLLKTIAKLAANGEEIRFTHDDTLI